MKNLSKRINENRELLLEAEQSKLQKEYDAYFRETLKSFDTEKISTLSAEKKKEFFSAIKSGWVRGKGRKNK